MKIDITNYSKEAQQALSDYGGFLLTHEQVSNLIADLTDYYRRNSPESIFEHNNALYKKHFGYDLKDIERDKQSRL